MMPPEGFSNLSPLSLGSSPAQQQQQQAVEVGGFHPRYATEPTYQMAGANGSQQQQQQKNKVRKGGRGRGHGRGRGNANARLINGNPHPQSAPEQLQNEYRDTRQASRGGRSAGSGRRRGGGPRGGAAAAARARAQGPPPVALSELPAFDVPPPSFGRPPPEAEARVGYNCSQQLQQRPRGPPRDRQRAQGQLDHQHQQQQPLRGRGGNRNRNVNNNRRRNIEEPSASKSNTDQVPTPVQKPPPAASDYHELGQRDRLIQQLNHAQLECMVCLDKIRQNHAIWDCQKCYQVFHIHCLKKWSQTTRDESGVWQCPACRAEYPSAPRRYTCFCRKVCDPEWNRGVDTPHSCGQLCGKSRENCNHACAELCHPGPCPPCEASIKMSCSCGATSRFARCGAEIVCDAVCDKPLNCGVHQCQRQCHKGPCGDCEELVAQSCFCSKSTKSPVCNAETSLIRFYACGDICGHTLDCGQHTCTKLCHEGSCDPCQLTPKRVSSCPCGQTSLEKLEERDGVAPRTSCLDPIPTCGKVCRKLLGCGKKGNKHRCEALCHDGPCPKCPLTTPVRCRCGSMQDKEVACSKLADLKEHENPDSGDEKKVAPRVSEDVLCEKRCTKKRLCGRHKCNQRCCIEIDHVCPFVCDKQLKCGRHRCEDPCHSGSCHSCPYVSFDELHCRCGAQVLYPPIACGTRPPPCELPCTRSHSCSHDVMHNCHPDENCPPCTMLMEKWCYGKHESRKAVPCHLEGISCGRPCGKALPCGRHTCILSCHDGPCFKGPDYTCNQKCMVKRESCDHICGNRCHDGPCPQNSCKEKVKVPCQCGNLSALKICGDQVSEFKRLQMAQLVSATQNGTITYNGLGAGSKGKIPCNEECAQLERNRRLALALQIENPDQSAKLSAPKYSEFMRNWVKKDAKFANTIYNKLVDLVKLAKESKQRNRSYSFEVMNRDRRQFVHEYCGHFGIESESFDEEPNRNVIATAWRERVWIPSQSLVDVVTGTKRTWKGPVSSLNSSTKLSYSGVSMVSMSSLRRPAPLTGSMHKSQTVPANLEQQKQQKPANIDYFDFDD